MSELQGWRDLGEDPPRPTPDVLERVQRRARRSVLRRRLVATTTALALVGAGGVASWAWGERPGARDSVYVDEPIPAPPPGCASFACPEKRRPPAADCDDRQFDYCPDGKPGWSTGLTSCQVTEALDSSRGTRLPAPGVSMRLELLGESVTAGTPAPARLVVRNEGEEHVRFVVAPTPSGGDFEARALGPGGGNARHGSDLGRQAMLDLDPGETDAVPLLVPTVSCADTFGMQESPLAPGRYDVSLKLVWSGLTVGDGPQPGSTAAAAGYWVGTAVLQVR